MVTVVTSKITDHTIANIIIMKTFEIFQDLPKRDTETGASKCCWKTGLTHFLDAGLPQTLFVKKKKKKKQHL